MRNEKSTDGKRLDQNKEDSCRPSSHHGRVDDCDFIRGFWELHEANKTLRDFSGSLIAKDYVRAYSLTAPELQKFTDYKAFVKVHEDLNTKLGNLTEAEINQTEVNDQRDGWFATASVRLIFTDASLRFTFVLKKEGRAWKVNSYHQQ